MSDRENSRTEEPEDVRSVNRRTALKVVAAAPLLASFAFAPPEIAEAQRKTEVALASGEAFVPKFFTPHEWQTARVLMDLIIPRDSRSGSASDVGTAEFMDFMMLDKPDMQNWMRPGLQWLDAEMQKRFGKTFVDAAHAQQAELLDVIAWPDKAPADMKDGTRFFERFRNLAMTGFWTSKVGIADLQYRGNTVVPHWNGCPQSALDHLHVSYE